MILLSPAKTQNFTTAPTTNRGVLSAYLPEAKVLCAELKEYDIKKIRDLMQISDNLAILNIDRFKNWSPTFNTQKQNADGVYNFKQAILAFRGDVYTAFEHNSFTANEYIEMEKSLRIISGLYGLLSPLTYIKPYRLEMKTRLHFIHKGIEYHNLYEYWRELVTTDLHKQLKKDEIIINLASNEYAKAINFKVIPNKKIDIEFKNTKNGVPKVVALFAKRQRGEMAVWAIKNKAYTVAELKKYKNDGYAYCAKLSSADSLVFLKAQPSTT